jgi:N-acetylglutamate synthase
MRNPTAALSPADVEAIERATLDAVPPQACEEHLGWLMPFDPGTVGRAHSAVPLRHDAPPLEVFGEAVSRYGTRDLPAVFRVPRLAAFDEFQALLADSGFASGKPTLVQVASAGDVAVLASPVPVQLASSTTQEWDSLFLGPGFDPVDATSRLGILRRAKSSMFASVHVDGQLAAVGSACFSHGWASVHGMRTAQAFRGRGLAGSILARFAQEAIARGTTRVFLQVEEANLGAQSLYRRAGFASAWAYQYWKADPAA